MGHYRWVRLLGYDKVHILIYIILRQGSANRQNLYFCFQFLGPEAPQQYLDYYQGAVAYSPVNKLNA